MKAQAGAGPRLLPTSWPHPACRGHATSLRLGQRSQSRRHSHNSHLTWWNHLPFYIFSALLGIEPKALHI